MGTIYLNGQPIRGVIDPMSLGAAPGNSASGPDCAPYIQAALNAASPGEVVWLGPGTWVCNSNLSIPDRVALMANWQYGMTLDVQGGVPVSNAPTAGTVLVNNWTGSGGADSSTPFIQLGNYSTIKGLAIYDNIQGTGTSARPYQIAAGYGAGGLGTGNAITPAVVDCSLLNCYRGIRFWGGGRGIIENTYICALYNGIWIDQQGDTTRLSKVAIVPTFYLDGSSASAAAQAYIQANLIGYRVGRADGMSMTDCMIYLASTGLRLENTTQSGTPTAPWITARGLCLDVCDVCLDVYGLAYQGVDIAGGSFTGFNGTTSTNLALRIASTVPQVTNNLRISNVVMATQTGQIGAIAGGDTLIGNCHFNSNGGSATASYAFVQSGGDLTIGTSRFANAIGQIDNTGSGKSIMVGCRTASGVSVGGTVTQAGNN